MRDTTPPETESIGERTQRLSRANRGVSEVLGAILIFAIIILLITILQLTAVPAANQQVEFEHNQRVQSDMQQLSDSVSQTVLSGVGTTTSVETGTGYPPRFFLFNPPKATGQIRTTDPGDIVLENVNATGEAGDYLNGSELRFQTRAISYRPDYNEYRFGPRTVLENGIIFNEHQNGVRIVEQRGALVNDRRISLVALQGQLSTGSDTSVSVGTVPISAPARTVSVSSTSGPMMITVPTELPATQWREDILDTEIARGYVVTVSQVPDEDAITVALQANVTYELRIAAVGVGDGFDEPREPQYITDVEGNGTRVPTGEKQQVVAEVRDKYNNPVSNVSVDIRAGVTAGTVRVLGSDRTDANGQVTLEYTAPSAGSGVTEDTVTATFGQDAGPQQHANFTLSVFDPTAGNNNNNNNTGGGINPSTTVRLNTAELVNPGGVNENCNTRTTRCYVEVTLENRNAVERKVSQMRVGFYSTDDNYISPEIVEITDSDFQSGDTVNNLTLGNNLQSTTLDNLQGTIGAEQQYELRFKRASIVNQGSGRITYDDGVLTGDFFVLEVEYRNVATNERFTETYFVGPSARGG